MALTISIAENHHLESSSSQTARTCRSPQKRMDFFCAISIQIYEKISNPPADDKTDAGTGRDVTDPWYTGDFEEAFQDILEGCEAMILGR